MIIEVFALVFAFSIVMLFFAATGRDGDALGVFSGIVIVVLGLLVLVEGVTVQSGSSLVGSTFTQTNVTGNVTANETYTSTTETLVNTYTPINFGITDFNQMLGLAVLGLGLFLTYNYLRV